MKKLIIISVLAVIAIGFSTTTYGQLLPRAIMPPGRLHSIRLPEHAYLYNHHDSYASDRHKVSFMALTQDQTFITIRSGPLRLKHWNSAYLADAVPIAAIRNNT